MRPVHSPKAPLAKDTSPFHEGEKTLQRENGSRDMMEQIGNRVIRTYMPDQHRAFFAQLPFLVIGAVDAAGRPWASILPGEPGFMHSPDNRHLDIEVLAHAADPVRAALHPGAPVGLLGIEPHSRRRNRMNGRITRLDDNLMQVRVDQSFGNCPQYIQHRDVTFLRPAEDCAPASPSKPFDAFDSEARQLISQTDVFFVASAVSAQDDPVTQGVDVSHRGGRPGFVKIEGNSLIIPDFPGNNHFNTFGNFLLNPKAGLVIPDFETGNLLFLTGQTELLPKETFEHQGFRGAERGWRFTLDSGFWLRDALPFRARLGAFSPNSLLADTWQEAEDRQRLEDHRNLWRKFKVAHAQQESTVIRSFYLEPADGKGLLPFAAGQHLTLRHQIGGQTLVRNYTLSSAPGEGHYRISVKREAKGQVSQFLHDHIAPGDILEIQAPRGDFFVDAQQDRPAVFLAGGVGITPAVAMAQHVLRDGVRTRKLRPMTVLHAARNTAERAFAAEFRQLQEQSDGKIRYLSIVSAPQKGERPGIDFNGIGHISAEILQQALPLDDYDFFLCGPAPFMQAMYGLLRNLGVTDTRISAETFGPSTLIRDNADAQPAVDEAEAATVSFAASTIQHDWSASDGTLLDFAEAKGLTPPSSCRSGSCGSCATRILAGAVSYRSPPSAEIDAQTALICCARPAQSETPLKLDL